MKHFCFALLVAASWSASAQSDARPTGRNCDLSAPPADAGGRRNARIAASAAPLPATIGRERAGTATETDKCAPMGVFVRIPARPGPPGVT